jgi:hypothetical protein
MRCSFGRVRTSLALAVTGVALLTGIAVATVIPRDMSKQLELIEAQKDGAVVYGTIVASRTQMLEDVLRFVPFTVLTVKVEQAISPANLSNELTVYVPGAGEERLTITPSDDEMRVGESVLMFLRADAGIRNHDATAFKVDSFAENPAHAEEPQGRSHRPRRRRELRRREQHETVRPQPPDHRRRRRPQGRAVEAEVSKEHTQMNISPRFFVLSGAAALAITFAWPSTSTGFATIGGSLGIGTTGNGYQRDVRVWNNAADAAANNNVTPEANHPGALGAPLSVWKAAEAWNSNTAGAARNFDYDWQGGLATSAGNNSNTVFWGTDSCGGGHARLHGHADLGRLVHLDVRELDVGGRAWHRLRQPDRHPGRRGARARSRARARSLGGQLRWLLRRADHDVPRRFAAPVPSSARSPRTTKPVCSRSTAPSRATSRRSPRSPARSSSVRC